MMPYWVRIGIGAALGLAAAVALWLLVDAAWLTALAAGLLAPIGFLGSYFIWSADRPEEGYEQVLFDKPNTIVAGALLVGFALVGVGSGLVSLGGGAAPSPTDGVALLYADYVRASDAYGKQEADAAATAARLAELRVESDRLAIELEAIEASEARDAAVAANDALAFAMDSLTACTEGVQDECMNARLSAADAQAALERAGLA